MPKSFLVKTPERINTGLNVPGSRSPTSCNEERDSTDPEWRNLESQSKLMLNNCVVSTKQAWPCTESSQADVLRSEEHSSQVKSLIHRDWLSEASAATSRQREPESVSSSGWRSDEKEYNIDLNSGVTTTKYSNNPEKQRLEKCQFSNNPDSSKCLKALEVESSVWDIHSQPISGNSPVTPIPFHPVLSSPLFPSVTHPDIVRRLSLSHENKKLLRCDKVDPFKSDLHFQEISQKKLQQKVMQALVERSIKSNLFNSITSFNEGLSSSILPLLPITAVPPFFLPSSLSRSTPMFQPYHPYVIRPPYVSLDISASSKAYLGIPPPTDSTRKLPGEQSVRSSRPRDRTMTGHQITHSSCSWQATDAQLLPVQSEDFKTLLELRRRICGRSLNSLSKGIGKPLKNDRIRDRSCTRSSARAGVREVFNWLVDGLDDSQPSRFKISPFKSTKNYASRDAHCCAVGPEYRGLSDQLVEQSGTHSEPHHSSNLLCQCGICSTSRKTSKSAATSAYSRGEAKDFMFKQQKHMRPLTYQSGSQVQKSGDGIASAEVLVADEEMMLSRQLGGESDRMERERLACKHCAKLYSSLGALKMHIRTHTLPCRCAICGKAFSRPWLLQGHIRTHTGEKPFRCLQCDRAFADRSNLRAHQQTHTELKKYRCAACPKTFSRLSLLVKHRNNTGCPPVVPALSVNNNNNTGCLPVVAALSVNNNNNTGCLPVVPALSVTNNNNTGCPPVIPALSVNNINKTGCLPVVEALSVNNNNNNIGCLPVVPALNVNNNNTGCLLVVPALSVNNNNSTGCIPVVTAFSGYNNNKTDGPS